MAKHTLKLEMVTGRMLKEFADHTGESLLTLGEQWGKSDGEIDISSLDVDVLVGLIWLAMKMSGSPDATWEDALDESIVNLVFDVDAGGGQEDQDPT